MTTPRSLVVATLTSALAVSFAAPPAHAAAPAGDPEAIAVPATQQPSASWGTALNAPAIRSYLRSQDEEYMVIAAGEASDELGEVARTLSARLRQNSRTVVDSDWLTGTQDDDDGAIVAAVAEGAVVPDAIIIARLFEDDLVVSIYDTKGEVLDGFILTRGESLRPRAGSGSTGGVSDEAAEAVSEVVDSAEDDEEVRSESYERNHLHYRQTAYLNPYTGEVGVRETDELLRGSADRPISVEEALRHMGHTDLADTYRRRGKTKTGLIVGGSILTLGLPVATALILFNDDYDVTVPPSAAGALAVAGVGTVMLITGIALRRGVTKNDMRNYVADYNETLEDSLDGEPRPMRARVQFAPVANRNGGGLVLSGQF